MSTNNKTQLTGNQTRRFDILDGVPLQDIVDNARLLHDALYAPGAPNTADVTLIKQWADLHNYLIDGILAGKLTLARLPTKL